MKKLFMAILNFFRSIFRKKQLIPESIPVPVIELEKPKKDWRSPAETRSLLKQLRPGDQLFFGWAGSPLAIYRIMNRRKIGVLVEGEDGHRWKIHFMGLQSKTFSPDLPS